MSRTKGKREAATGGSWHRGGDPFAGESAPKGTKAGGKGKKAALIALSCVLLAAAAVTVWWFTSVRAPDVSGNDRPGVTNNNPSLKPSDTDSVTDGPEAAAGRKEDFFTFLLLGKDTSSGSTDTIILVSYDVPNQQVNMMSIPRDTAVNVPWSVKKINSVYSAKESSGGGLENLKKQVGYLTGVMPDRYVIVEWEAVGEIVEAVGGVEFDVPRNMNYDDPYQNLHIHINKGLQTLDGKQAMGVIRYRHDNRRPDGTMPGYADGDLGRTETQQAFLKAMAKKVLQLQNVTKVGNFVKTFLDHVETDMDLTEMMWFATKAMGMDADAIQACTMPNEAHTFRGGSYVFANIDELVTLVNEQFNPYNREVTADDLQIMVRKSNGSAYVTNGELLDSRWSKGSSGSSSKPKDPDPEPAPEPDEPSQPSDEPSLPDPGTSGQPGGGTAAPPESSDPGMTADPEQPENPGNSGDPEQPENPGESDPGTGSPDTPDTPDAPDTPPQEGPGGAPPASVPAPGREPELPPEPTLPPVEDLTADGGAAA